MLDAHRPASSTYCRAAMASYVSSARSPKLDRLRSVSTVCRTRAASRTGPLTSHASLVPSAVYPLSKAISTPFSISNELVMTTPVAIELPGDGLAPGETVTIELLVHGAIPGLLDLRFLCVYQVRSHLSFGMSLPR
jgi:hypothetical protein